MDHFNYSISWRSKNYRYGNHLSSKIGNDFEYSGSQNFNEHPDLSSIDIKNSITDPYENIFVKTFNLNNPVNLVALCDISSSMFTVEKNNSTIKILAKIIAASAVEHGDIFSMVCYNDALKNNFFLEPSNNIFNINRWIDALVLEGPRATSDDVAGITHKMPYEKSLVFWISDFHHRHERIDTMIDQLSNHHVIPVYLSSENEINSFSPSFSRRLIYCPEDLSFEHLIKVTKEDYDGSSTQNTNGQQQEANKDSKSSKTNKISKSRSMR